MGPVMKIFEWKKQKHLEIKQNYWRSFNWTPPCWKDIAIKPKVSTKMTEKSYPRLALVFSYLVIFAESKPAFVEIQIVASSWKTLKLVKDIRWVTLKSCQFNTFFTRSKLFGQILCNFFDRKISISHEIKNAPLPNGLVSPKIQFSGY